MVLYFMQQKLFKASIPNTFTTLLVNKKLQYRDYKDKNIATKIELEY